MTVKKSKGFIVTATEYKALDVGRVRRGIDVMLTKGEKQL
ncbi:hypothetical protein NBRC116592_18150 [Colwellia sp. KU-HH00111]